MVSSSKCPIDVHYTTLQSVALVNSTNIQVQNTFKTIKPFILDTTSTLLTPHLCQDSCFGSKGAWLTALSSIIQQTVCFYNEEPLICPFGVCERLCYECTFLCFLLLAKLFVSIALVCLSWLVLVERWIEYFWYHSLYDANGLRN